MSQTVKFTFLNVAYRPTVYETGQKQSEYFLFFQIIPLPWVFLWTVLQYYRYIRTVTLSYSLASFLAGLDRNLVYGTVPNNSYRFWADLLHKWSFNEYWSKLPCLKSIHNWVNVKLMFSKKATKFDEIFTVNLTLCSKC